MNDEDDDSEEDEDEDDEEDILEDNIEHEIHLNDMAEAANAVEQKAVAAVQQQQLKKQPQQAADLIVSYSAFQAEAASLSTGAGNC
jgi:hypothetical protein